MRHLIPKEYNGVISIKHRGNVIIQEAFGYGLWLEKINGRNFPYFEGCERGISFRSTYDEIDDLLITLFSNKGDDVWKLDKKILREFYSDIPS